MTRRRQVARTVTARDLLRLFLELRRLQPDMRQWSEVGLTGDPPLDYRSEQLFVLFRAFGIDGGPDSFTEGKFIALQSPRYDSLIARLATEMPSAVEHGLEDARFDLRWMFAWLLEYRERVEATLSFPAGLLAASGLGFIAYQKAVELTRVIQANVASIDDILIAVISPEGKTHAVDQLARDYGYPDVNLSAIDAEWDD
jgi:hypothetical protein